MFTSPCADSYYFAVRPAVTKKDGQYRRGPKVLSSEEIERLAKLGDQVDRIGHERRKRRAELKALTREFHKQVQEHFRRKRVRQALFEADKDLVAVADELHGFELELAETSLDGKKVYETKFVFTLE